MYSFSQPGFASVMTKGSASSVALRFSEGAQHVQNMSTPLSNEVSVGVGGQAGPASPLRKSLAASKWIILASLLSFVTVYWTTCSYLDIQADLGRWGCRMSWMSPNYVRLAGPSGSAVRGLERKYGLWLYREGGLQSDVQVKTQAATTPASLI